MLGNSRGFATCNRRGLAENVHINRVGNEAHRPVAEAKLQSAGVRASPTGLTRIVDSWSADCGALCVVLQQHPRLGNERRFVVTCVGISPEGSLAIGSSGLGRCTLADE